MCCCCSHRDCCDNDRCIDSCCCAADAADADERADDGATSSSGERWILPALVALAAFGGVDCLSPVLVWPVIAIMLCADEFTAPVSGARNATIKNWHRNLKCLCHVASSIRDG